MKSLKNVLWLTKWILLNILQKEKFFKDWDRGDPSFIFSSFKISVLGRLEEFTNQIKKLETKKKKLETALKKFWKRDFFVSQNYWGRQVSKLTCTQYHMSCVCLLYEVESYFIEWALYVNSWCQIPFPVDTCCLRRDRNGEQLLVRKLDYRRLLCKIN